MASVSFKSEAWKTRVQSTMRTRKWKNTKQILAIEAERFATLPIDDYTFYRNLKVPPSLMPAKKYCDITGFLAPYTDPKTGLRFCSTETFHQIQNLSPSDVEKLLALRGAAVSLK
eukprot:TRINITY_DN13148_c0_g1_i1.p1 TRINITY_DN13148_c0_g1~~TRINITY_DN13148_c0_g1_i1.p1  ORF type:complete len:131 (+),score=18.65 TRINITY_DN13148_c0_g1_i1:49-393(+)